MTTILIVQKDGNIKETNVKQISEEELYKKAGFRTGDGFKVYTTWTVENVNDKTYHLSVYGKTDGRANQENKYEFPPPIDNTLFFGNCVIVNKSGEQFDHLTVEEWDVIYDKLYGGFEDLNSEDDSESEDDDSGAPRTKSGYVKDGFIVDDDEEDEDEDEDEEDEDYEDEDDDDDDVPKKKKRKSSKKVKKPIKLPKKVAKPAKVVPATVFPSLENELDCTNELCEEDYIVE
jgi:hypothetical protein